MLSLTRKSEYALVAICYLARANKQVVSAREIAEQRAVPLPLLMNVLKKLNQAGQVRSLRGARGGYILALSPEELNLAEVIEAVDGPVRLVKCVPGPPELRRKCERVGLCTLRQPLHKVHYRLIQVLAGVTVADLAFDGPDSQTGRRRGVAKAGAP